MKQKYLENCDLLACELYEFYCQQVGGKAFNGDPLPNWEEFKSDPKKTKQSQAWIAVAKRTIDLSLEDGE